MLGKVGKLIVGEVITEGEGDEATVGDVVGVEGAGAIFFIEFMVSKFGSYPFIDDLVGFDFSEVFDSGVIFTSGFEEVTFEVVTDLFEIEDDLVVTEVLGEYDAIAVSDISSDTWLADGDRVV